VARLAGVSPSTVSRAINEPLLVRKDTVDIVNRAIRQIGYTPNFLAGGLASNRTRLVAVIVPAIANSIFADTVQAVTDRMSAEGYQTLVGLTGYDLHKEDDLLQAVLGRRPDGLILTGTVHSAASKARILAANIPTVETWDLTTSPLDMAVGFSQAAVGQAIGRYMLGKGYKRFGLLFSTDQRALTRLAALQAELDRTECLSRTIKVPPANDIGLGRCGLSDLLTGEWTPDAIICSSDALALGVMAEARSRNCKVPDEFAVMGFGDLDFGGFTSPSLSTVHIERAQIGRDAAEALLARLKGKPVPNQVIDVGFSIVSRESA
jgi:LacI family gluconate utilization system Gnt-I transcriptional repressor